MSLGVDDGRTLVGSVVGRPVIQRGVEVMEVPSVHKNVPSVTWSDKPVHTQLYVFSPAACHNENGQYTIKVIIVKAK